MPTGVPLSSQQQDIVRAVIMEGKTDKEAMLVSGVSRSAISRIRAKLRSSGASIPAPSMPSTPAAAVAAPKTNGNGHHRPTLLKKAKAFRQGKAHTTHASLRGNTNNPERQARVQKYMAKGWSTLKIAKKLGITEGTAGYWITKVNKLSGARATSATNASGSVVGTKKGLGSKVAFYMSKGWKTPQIAQRLGLAPQTVYYHVNKLQKQATAATPATEETSGNSNAFSKDIRIGIAFAETERFVNAIGERLALPPTILRRRLSELLGHSPVR